MTRCTVRGATPDQPESASVPTDQKLGDGQYADHWVLCEAERAKGFIRPMRDSYTHEKCGEVTTMPRACAETYARQPDYYGSTFCCRCQGYFPVGPQGEFMWNDGTKVGT
jgi:hypothetical protein